MENILSINFLSDLLTASVRMATPLLFAGMGELFSEKAGLVNIGLEGLMTMGACVTFVTGYMFGNPYLGLVFGMLAAVLLNMIYAVSSVSLGANQTVNGMALNILAPAAATYIYRSYFGISASLIVGKMIPNASIPVLKDIPIIGRALFGSSPLMYIALAVLLASLIFFYKTRVGLNYTAVGEHPKACETLGINVVAYKYIACVICGALCGLGGGFLVTSYVSSYSNGVVAGRGFIALATVIFGSWKPHGVLLAALLFGFADVSQLRLQLLLPNVPYQFMSMLPYIITILALALRSKGSQGPKTAGQPYIRESD